MAVETPAYWDTDVELQEKIPETTAYGNPVMIPKRYQSAWELQHEMLEFCKKRGIDPPAYYQEERPMRPRAYDAMQVYWERYRRQN